MQIGGKYCSLVGTKFTYEVPFLKLKLEGLFTSTFGGGMIWYSCGRNLLNPRMSVHFVPHDNGGSRWCGGTQLIPSLGLHERFLLYLIHAILSPTGQDVG